MEWFGHNDNPDEDLQTFSAPGWCIFCGFAQRGLCHTPHYHRCRQVESRWGDVFDHLHDPFAAALPGHIGAAAVIMAVLRFGRLSGQKS